MSDHEDLADVHLAINGANLEVQVPEFQAEFTKTLAECGENVTFVGRYEPHEVSRLMAGVDWVVIPSIWWENSPLVIQEAFMNQRPVICSDIGGMAEKVQHEVNGLHFRVGNPVSLARTVRRAVSDPGLWDRLREGIPKVFPIQECVDLHARLFSSLLGGGGVPWEFTGDRNFDYRPDGSWGAEQPAGGAA